MDQRATGPTKDHFGGTEDPKKMILGKEEATHTQNLLDAEAAKRQSAQRSANTVSKGFLEPKRWQIIS